MSNLNPIPAIIKRGKRKENVMILNYTLETKQDGQDICWSEDYVATGRPDGRHIFGWNEYLDADIMIDATKRLKDGEFKCPSFCADSIVVDGIEWVIIETGYRGSFLAKVKAIIQIKASRYIEDRRTIQYHR